MNDKNETDDLTYDPRLRDLVTELLCMALTEREHAEEKIRDFIKPVIDTPQHLTTEEKILEEVKTIKKILGELK
tara:strand:+ start:462 stop:683 length:222 start_codon:yes stop_codon:yes gene_type:complete